MKLCRHIGFQFNFCLNYLKDRYLFGGRHRWQDNSKTYFGAVGYERLFHQQIGNK
jgi:hypothetical protein